MPIDYVTVYEISHRFPDWWFACIGSIPLLVGAVIIWGKRRFKWREPNWFFGPSLCLFGVFWIVGVGRTTLQNDSDAFTAYQKGDYQIVEGVVTDFHPMPYEGHQNECFSVGDRRFCYSDYEIAPGFHNAASHGGPIRAGLTVRIAYRAGRILKLEIPKAEALTPAQAAAISSRGERQWQERTENDPFDQEMDIAATFTGVCWTLWWNLQWKRAIRFWVQPPHRPWVERAFRVFFALNFLGVLDRLIRQLRTHPITRENFLPTAEIAAVMCAVVTIMSALGLWMIQRRDTKKQPAEA